MDGQGWGEAGVSEGPARGVVSHINAFCALEQRLGQVHNRDVAFRATRPETRGARTLPLTSLGSSTYMGLNSGALGLRTFTLMVPTVC